MRVAILITARLGSTRLARKHLLPVLGRPILQYLVDAVNREFTAEISRGEVVFAIATSERPENLEFSKTIQGCAVFAGSDENIPLRHLQALEYFDADAVLSIDGDDILCSPRAMRAVYGALARGALLAKTEGLPLGMNAMGYSGALLRRALERFGNDKLETGWSRIFEGVEAVVVTISCSAPNNLRFTLDYEEDYRFFIALLEEPSISSGAASDDDIIRTVLTRGLDKITQPLVDKYWKNFYENINKEEERRKCMNYNERLARVIPGGAHTYSRGADQYPENAPQILKKGKGSYVWDPEGNKYLDYGMALRAVTVGYGYEPIVLAAMEQAMYGNNLTRPSSIELEAAELFTSLIPWAEMVKFGKNGSTVTTAAVKLARAYNGRKYVAFCAQHPFFSYDDWFIGSTVMTRGVPQEISQLSLKFDYNDIASLEALFAKYPGEISCVILEPATTVGPKDGFLHKVKELCKKNGAVFILDEMITGFRFHLQGASKYFDIEPDLCTFGKGMANGFSVAALAGKRELMELGGIDKEGMERTFLVSTTHGAEMCGLGAFVKTVEVYKELGVVDHLWAYGEKLMAGMNGVAKELGIEKYFYVEGYACHPNYITKDPRENASFEFRTLFSQEMIKNGVLMPWIALCYEQGESELSMTLDAVRKSLSVYRQALEQGVGKFLNGRAIRPVFRKYN